jgi:hypothetical protein
MPKPQQQFDIGDWVLVGATVSFEYDSKGNRRPVRERCGVFSAQVVGAKYRQVGTYEGSTAHYSPLGDCDVDPPYLHCKGTVCVWLVRRGMTNRAIEVLPDDLHTPEIRGHKLPWRFAKHLPWPDWAREDAREAALAAPRKNGKFTKS